MDDPQRVDYRQGAKIGKNVDPQDLPAKRVDEEPTAKGQSKGPGEGTRNVSEAAPQDAALEEGGASGDD